MPSSMLLLNPRRKRRTNRKARRTTRKARAVRRAPRKRTVRRSPARKQRRIRHARRGDTIMLKTNPRRKARRVARRGSRRGSAGGFMGTIKELGSRDTLMLASGAIGAGLITSFVTSRYGTKLPGASSKAGAVSYAVGIPVLAAILVNKWSPKLAQGLLIGAVVQGVSAVAGDAINAAVTGTPTTAEYISETIPGNGRPAMGGIGYDSINAFGKSLNGTPGGVDRSWSSAFKNDPWQ